MIEIFENIPDSTKERAAAAFDLAMLLHSPLAATNFLNEYTNSCINEEEKEFVKFYFNMRLEHLLNENNNDQR